MIPWDDDVDIVMPRSDYDRLCDIYADTHQTQRYQIVNHRNHPEVETRISYFNDFSTITDAIGELQKYRGIHIDVYPIDVVPNDYKKRKRLLAQRHRLQKTIKLRGIHPELFSGFQKFGRMLIKGFYSMISKDSIYDDLNSASKAYADLPLEEGSEVACLVEGGRVQVFDRKVLDKYCLYKFGENEFMGFEDYDKPLKEWYGDYMTPPPKEAQKVQASKWVRHFYKDNI
jgi:lipopolysaccharide cholinephosphotransferase